MIRFRRARFLNTSAVVVALTLAMTATSLHTAAAGPTPNWGPVNSTQQPPAGRAFAAMSYDSLRGRTVMFGGGPTTGPNFSDTWEWDGTTWTQKTPANSPPGLVGAAMVFDNGLGHSVLFGGAPGPGPLFAGTWEWDGTAWTLRSFPASPQGRLWHAMAYDSARNRVVLFGGTGQGGLSSTMGDTWEFDGSSWNELFPTTSPSPRYGEAMSFDSVRNRVVLFGGRDASGVRLGDTWEWDGANWTLRSSTSAPYARFWHSMAFDVQEGKTVLFGGDHVGSFGLGPINDTWEWDGAQWSQVWPSGAPAPRSAQSMVYDSGRGRMVLFGGLNALFTQPAYNDTWELGTGIVTPPGTPIMTFDHSYMAFENVNVGSTSVPQKVFPINSGTGPLLISSIGTTGDFIASTDCPIAPNALAAGTFCRVTVAFSPTAVGARYGSLVLTDNGPNGAQTMQLQATGVGNASLLLVNSATARLGGSMSISASLTASGAPVSGAAVTFTLPNSVSATIQTDSQGIALWASASLAGIAVGSYPGGIQGTFGGNQTLLATSASATLTVVPDTDLALAGVPSDISVNAADSSGAAVTYTAPTAVDESGDSSAAAVNCAPTSGSSFAIGTTTVTCTATDGDDTPSAVTQTFNVTVLDTDLALAGVPANVTANAAHSSGAIVTFAAPTAVDEAGDTSGAAVSCTPASGSTFAIGITPVTCTATDGDEGPVNRTFTVTVLDTDLAITGVPANITINASGSSGAVVTYVAPTAVDEAGDTSVAVVNCTPASGSTFAIGTTTVTCTATDGDDTPGTVSQAFTITVLDTDLALTGVPTNITVNANSPRGAMVTYSQPTTVDEAGDSPAASESCTPISGSTFAIGTTTVTCTATDADDSPGSVSQAFTVTVLDTDLALTGVPAGITVNATTKSGAVVTYSAPRAADEAGDSAAVTAVCAPASGSTFAVGTTTVNCTATSADDSPSTVSAKFTVTVLVDLRLAVSISPTTATNGTVVTAHVSLTNSASVSRTVTMVATFSSVSPTGQTITRTSSRVTITLAAGKTAIRSFTFEVERDFPRGNYSFTATASDVTGSVSSGGTFKVI